MIIYILDGYNVIHAVPFLKKRLDESLQSAREALVAACAGFKASRGDIRSITIVFDGQDPSHTNAGPAGIHVVFTGRREEADDRIIRIAQSHASGEVCIVSNDNTVSNNSRAHRARVLSAREFFDRMTKPGKEELIDQKLNPQSPICKSITEAYRKHLGL